MIVTPEITADFGSIIDTHAHYDDKKFDGIRDELLCRLNSLGVGKVINCGCTVQSSKDCIELALKYPVCYAAVGYHPSSLPNCDIDIYAIEKLLENKRVVAVGEIGLDYYWQKDNKDAQKKAFREQLVLAKQYDLPVIVHDREAHFDTMQILTEYAPRGVIHCFSGSVESAKQLVKMKMYIGIGGVLTFKNSKQLKSVAESIPLDNILLETDAPYLAPEPFRGKINNSSLIKLVADTLAEIKGVSTEEVIKITSKNATDLFKF